MEEFVLTDEWQEVAETAEAVIGQVRGAPALLAFGDEPSGGALEIGIRVGSGGQDGGALNFTFPSAVSVWARRAPGFGPSVLTIWSA